MTTSFRLPDLGEGIHEAEILAISVQPGQHVSEGDVILEVETDKAAVEIPSPVSGDIEEIHCSPGDVVEVGDVLLSFAKKKSRETVDPKKQVQTEQTETADNRGEQDKRRPPVPASPATRRLARELGVDLFDVEATGDHGRVSKEDVRRTAADNTAKKKEGAEKKRGEIDAGAARSLKPRSHPGSQAGLPDFSQWGEIEKQPFRSIRRATAKRMAVSWAEIPHVNCQDVADITQLEEFRKRHKKEIEKAGGRLTMTVFAIKAVATALKQFPHFNASLDLDNEEIILKKYFHIGVAVDTKHGLVVPVIRDVDRKSIREIAVELNQAVDRARTRNSSREELVGGTFTVTNAGAVGGAHFSAIINHPEIAILGMGQSKMMPAVHTDDVGKHEIVARLQMPVVLCFDHRVVDGADAIRFLRVIIDVLQDPDELLITMT